MPTVRPSDDRGPTSFGVVRAFRAEARRNAALRWAARAVACVALVSLAAPILPLASPAAVDLERAFEPPVWAVWEERARPATGGDDPTRVLGGLLDDGWRHRAILEVESSSERDVGARIEDVVRATAGRAPRRVTRELAPDRSLHRFVVPLRGDDRARVDWRATGREGVVRALVCRPAGERPRAWLSLALPLERARVAGASYDVASGELAIELVAGAGGDPASASFDARWLAYRCELALPADTIVDAIDLDGVRIDDAAAPSDAPAHDALAIDAAEAAAPREHATAASAQEAAARSPIGAEHAGAERSAWLARWLGAPLAAELERADGAGDANGADRGDARLELTDERGAPRVLAERLHARAHERVGTPHSSLGERVERALATALDDSARASLAAFAIEEHGWPLNAVDRALVAARAQIFGTWQCGPWLGRDSKGRDLLARLVWGSRTSLGVALAAALTSLVIGVAWGAIAGLAGGRTDDWMMRAVDVLYALPFVFLVIFLVTILNEYRAELYARGIDREVLLYLVIGAVWWLTMARVVRGQVLSIARSGFVEAARALGASPARILGVHVLPNVLPVVVVYLTLTIPQVMLFEAFLSFLGLGIEEPKVSWGTLASQALEAISPLRVFWWLVLFPAAAIGGLLLALNVVGDGLRDALDPEASA